MRGEKLNENVGVAGLSSTAVTAEAKTLERGKGRAKTHGGPEVAAEQREGDVPAFARVDWVGVGPAGARDAAKTPSPYVNGARWRKAALHFDPLWWRTR